MRKEWTLTLAAPAARGLGLLLVGERTDAADHLDAPGSTADPAADINDVYVFRSKDPAASGTPRTVFVMTVTPVAGSTSRFSDKVEYVFKIGDSGDAGSYDITCTADAAATQNVTCTGPGSVTDTVAFNAVQGAATDDMRVFAGLRDDPFFFDLDAFKAVQADAGAVGILLDDAGTDFLGGLNVLAIVVDVKNSVFGGATKLDVWAHTVRN